MLVVAVYGDNALAVGPVFQEIGKGGFESRALAPVDRMVQQGHFLMGVRRPLEPGEIFRLGAVVDQNNVRKSVLEQPLDHRVQLLVRVQGGEHYGNIRYTHNFASLSHTQYLQAL